ncbi:L-lactate permease [Brooklawnia sp.]|uniref:L-lactate permease n=1 Tax=Brooklawnia sp. TaxID=2699740 RepID=UPI00311F69EE
MQFQPDIAPVNGSLFLSALVALLPLLTIFLTLGVLRWRAHWAGLSAVAVAALVAVFAFHMPVGLTAMTALQGASFGIFPITWIVLCAIWMYELTVESGHFEDLRATFHMVSDDPRILAILIAFCFGGLMEALAGFGAPVAITGVMLMSIGYPPLRAALTVLLANTAPVAFGAIATPIITAGTLTGIPYQEIGATIGHQTPLLAWFVPLLLVFIVDGKRGVKEVWPAALTIGLSFAVAQWVSATWLSVELTDVVASLVGLAAGVVLLRFWKPKGTAEAAQRLTNMKQTEAEEGFHTTNDDADVKEVHKVSGSQIFMALMPYLLVIGIFCVAKLVKPVTAWLASTDIKIHWPGLWDGETALILTGAGAPNTSTIYNFQWLSSPGTLLLITGILVGLIYRMSPAVMAKVFGRQIYKLRWTFLTIASVLALAYVMNLSGQTITIGTWIAGAGAAFAFLSPILGWIGTAVTGSDTSANALFATLQQTAAANIGIDEHLLVAANTSGGVVGKMISPQNLAIAATAVGLVGKESDILRRAMPWSLGLLLVLCLIVGLQSTPVLGWMLPNFG